MHIKFLHLKYEIALVKSICTLFSKADKQKKYKYLNRKKIFYRLYPICIVYINLCNLDFRKRIMEYCKDVIFLQIKNKIFSLTLRPHLAFIHLYNRP